MDVVHESKILLSVFPFYQDFPKIDYVIKLYPIYFSLDDVP